MDTSCSALCHEMNVWIECMRRNDDMIVYDLTVTMECLAALVPYQENAVIYIVMYLFSSKATHWSTNVEKRINLKISSRVAQNSLLECVNIPDIFSMFQADI